MPNEFDDDFEDEEIISDETLNAFDAAMQEKDCNCVYCNPGEPRLASDRMLVKVIHELSRDELELYALGSALTLTYLIEDSEVEDATMPDLPYGRDEEAIDLSHSIADKVRQLVSEERN